MSESRRATPQGGEPRPPRRVGGGYRRCCPHALRAPAGQTEPGPWPGAATAAAVPRTPATRRLPTTRRAGHCRRRRQTLQLRCRRHRRRHRLSQCRRRPALPGGAPPHGYLHRPRHRRCEARHRRRGPGTAGEVLRPGVVGAWVAPPRQARGAGSTTVAAAGDWRRPTESADGFGRDEKHPADPSPAP